MVVELRFLELVTIH